PAVEALASGTPLVASRAGALPEVVGDCAVLVEPGNIDELASAIGGLLDAPRRRHALGAAGRDRALSIYSWSAVAAQTVSVYKRAVARTSGQYNEEANAC
ncbi:glycosyltransferase, partial [Nocardia gipuzkoensis]